MYISIMYMHIWDSSGSEDYCVTGWSGIAACARFRSWWPFMHHFMTSLARVN